MTHKQNSSILVEVDKELVCLSVVLFVASKQVNLQLDVVRLVGRSFFFSLLSLLDVLYIKADALAQL